VSVKWNCRWPDLNDVHKLADYCKELKAHDELITLLKVSQVVEQVLEQATLSQGTGAPLRQGTQECPSANKDPSKTAKMGNQTVCLSLLPPLQIFAGKKAKDDRDRFD